MFSISALARRALLLGASVAACALGAAPAAAAPTLTLSVSSPWAFAGFPLTVKVTSTEAGTISLMQLRKSRMIGPGRCVQNRVPFENELAGTTQPIAAGQTLKLKLDATRLVFAGGTPFAQPNFETCADPYTPFDRLVATFTAADNSVYSTSPPRRLQRVW